MHLNIQVHGQRLFKLIMKTLLFCSVFVAAAPFVSGLTLPDNKTQIRGGSVEKENEPSTGQRSVTTNRGMTVGVCSPANWEAV